MASGLETRACPSCGHEIPEIIGYTTWCDACGWNVVPRVPVAPPDGVREKLSAAAGRRLGAKLARKLTDETALEPRLTAPRVGAYVIAALVFGFVALLALVGTALAVVGLLAVNIVEIVVGLALVGIAWFMRPRPPTGPRAGVSRDEMPALHGLADRVADALGTPRVDLMVIDSDWNAAWLTAGYRRRRVLIVGLPLFHVLDPGQRVALVAHELAHARNGDATRGLVVGSSINGLAELYGFVSHEGPGDEDLVITLLAKPILWLLSRPAYLLLRLQIQLAQRDSHRAEYLADALAARVAGTAATVRLHEALLFETSLETALQRAAHSEVQDVDLFEELEDGIRSAPAREVERRRRVARLEDSRPDDSHPTTGLRIELLEARPVEPGLVAMTESESARIDAELSPIRVRMQRELVADFRSSLYEG